MGGQAGVGKLFNPRTLQRAPPPPHPPAGALPGALQRDGGDVFEGPAPTTPGSPSPQLAGCFWFVSIEGTPPGSAAGHVRTAVRVSDAASSAVGEPVTPGGSRDVPVVRSPLQTFASKAVPAKLAGLKMGPLVGSGSFGRGECARGDACAQWCIVWVGCGQESAARRRGDTGFPQQVCCCVLSFSTAHPLRLCCPPFPHPAVYRGEWDTGMVAVKLIECSFGRKGATVTDASAALAEAELSKSLDHPCIVKVCGVGARARNRRLS